MDFIVDQAISWQVARGLVAAGHRAAHVRDLGLATAKDGDILRKATDEGCVIITQDTDFGTLLAASSSKVPSVILVRMREGRPSIQARMLLDNLDGFAAALREGAVVVIGDASIRIRRLPLS